MTTRMRNLTTLASMLAVATIGCFGDDDSGGGEGVTTTTVGATTTTTLAAATSTTTTSTTSTTSTTTVTVPPRSCSCAVVWSMTNAETVGSLQWDTDYSLAAGTFEGSAAEVSCSKRAGDFIAFNDVDAQQKMSIALISTSGITGPLELAECRFETDNSSLAAADFTVTITDQAAPDFFPTQATVAITRVACVCDGSSTTTTLGTTTTVTTSSTSTTTTIIVDGERLLVEFTLDDAVTLGALQFEVDYSLAPGEFEGSAGAVVCTSPLSATGAFVTFNDDDRGNSKLGFAAVSLVGFSGPALVAACSFKPDAVPSADQFVVTVIDASDPGLIPLVPFPTVRVSLRSLSEPAAKFAASQALVGVDP